jgi:hypothetical protein
VNEADDNPLCWASVLAHLPPTTDPRISQEMLERHELGMRRYGVPLRVWNGRDALADAYQEALDLVVYLEQCRLRVPESTQPWDPYHPRDVVTSLRNEVVGVLTQLRALRGKVPTNRKVTP